MTGEGHMLKPTEPLVHCPYKSSERYRLLRASGLATFISFSLETKNCQKKCRSLIGFLHLQL